MTEPLLFDVPGRGAVDGSPSPEPMYASLEGWVLGQFVPMFRRPLGGEFRWCRQWWRHAEAIVRLTALWHSWEVLRLEAGTGMAAWLRDHLDHQLPVLLGRAGPFAHCSEDEHFEPHQALTELAPPGWWLPNPADTDDDGAYGGLYDDDGPDDDPPAGTAFGPPDPGAGSGAGPGVRGSGDDGDSSDGDVRGGEDAGGGGFRWP